MPSRLDLQISAGWGSGPEGPGGLGRVAGSFRGGSLLLELDSGTGLLGVGSPPPSPGWRATPRLGAGWLVGDSAIGAELGWIAARGWGGGVEPGESLGGGFGGLVLHYGDP
ncbi:MAG: hypothetical protein OEY14_11950, partial [Myxococcales bacterium]|nr:hypothetical protein [Myxococcales bacterium]